MTQITYDGTCPYCGKPVDDDLWEWFRGCDPVGERATVEDNCPHCGVELRVSVSVDPDLVDYEIMALPPEAYHRGSEVYD